MKLILGVFFLLWLGLLLTSLVSLTQGAGLINLVALIIIILSWKNAVGFLRLLRT